MAITVPQPGQQVSAELFGIPVANQLNAMGRCGGTWRRNAAHVVPAGSWQTITWDTEVNDTHSLLAPPATTVTIPAGQAGLYIVVLVYAVGLTAAMRMQITGVTEVISAPGDPITGYGNATFIGPLAVGNTIVCSVFQNTGINVNAYGRLDVWKVGI